MTAVSTIVTLSGCGGDVTPPGDSTGAIALASIVIDGGPRQLERGSVIALTATSRDTGQRVVVVPLVWRSTVDSIASFGRDGKLTTGATGSTFVTASALGVTSASVEIRVVWLGPGNIALLPYNTPNAVTPGVELADSVRFFVTDTGGRPSPGAKVSFSITEGGGTIAPASPALVTVGQNGVASAKWTLGPTAGKNTITATVVGGDSAPLAYVKAGSLSVKSYAALSIVQGDAQTGSVLAALPVVPSVKLVDSLGRPRPGVPVTFAPTNNGRVANTVVSTTVDGVASPGIWTLGDAEGTQQLIVSVEAAKISLSAAATGSTVRFSATQVATAQASTCVITADQFVSCMGQPPRIGTGDTTKTQSSPTLTQGGTKATSLAGGSSHFCATTPDLSIYCWGVNALVDTVNAFSPSGGAIATFAPARLQSNIAWLQVAAGGQHNCALANDRTAYCWGIDTVGQLGDGAVTRRLVPQPVTGGFKFNSVSAGASHSCGIATTTSAAFCWGLNQSGQLGDGTFANRGTPTSVSGTLRWKAIGAGANWTCGLIDDGTAHCWGAGGPGSSPQPYSAAPKFSTLTVGAQHACALDASGAAYCWGDNSSGQLGDSTTVSRQAPTAVAGTMRFTALSAAQQHTCGIATDGFLACWGRNTFGEIGVSTPLVQVTPRYVVIGVKP